MEFPANMDMEFPILPRRQESEPVPKGAVCDVSLSLSF